MEKKTTKTEVVMNKNYPWNHSSTRVLLHLSRFDLGNVKLLLPWRPTIYSPRVHSKRNCLSPLWTHCILYVCLKSQKMFPFNYSTSVNFTHTMTGRLLSWVVGYHSGADNISQLLLAFELLFIRNRTIHLYNRLKMNYCLVGTDTDL